VSGNTLPLPAPVPDAEGALEGGGFAFGHHGEILQGVFEASGSLRRGLVTLPCKAFRSTATFVARVGSSLVIDPSWKVKALCAARLTLDFLGRHDCGGSLVIRGNAPPGWGLGSSTSDVTAAIRAVGRAFRSELEPADVAMLAVKAETASDSVMFEDRTILFAQRQGLVLEELGYDLPPLDVVGFNTDGSGRGVDTTRMLPARYSWWEVERFQSLLAALRRAVREQDAALVGSVASASARINQSHLPKPSFDCLEALVERSGAVGLQVAHSGSVVGLLFAAHDPAKIDRIAEAVAAIEELRFPKPWHFCTRAPELAAEDGHTAYRLDRQGAES
jgi:uncharacterized protein involved in propanediol utilization